MLARGAYGQPAAYQGEKVAENAKGSPERFGYSWNAILELTPEQEQQFLMGWRICRWRKIGQARVSRTSAAGQGVIAIGL